MNQYKKYILNVMRYKADLLTPEEIEFCVENFPSETIDLALEFLNKQQIERCINSRR